MNKYIVGFLVLVVLTSSVYILLPDAVRIDIGGTYSTFKVWEDNSWVTAGQEYTILYDGTKKMRASSRSIEYFIEGTSTTIVRTANFKDGIIAIDTYTFDGNTTDVKLFPVSHNIQILNGEGKIFLYEVTKLHYTDETVSDITSPQSFGHKMKVEWEDGNYYSKIYKYVGKDEGKLSIRYRLDEPTETFNVRLFDPPPECTMTSVTPADIEANATGNFEMMVNCTSAAGFNVTMEGEHYTHAYFTSTVDDDGTLPNRWSIFYPDNDLAVTGGVFEERVLRATARNESHWYETIGQTELNDSIYDYAVYDGDYGHFKIQDNGTDWILFNITGEINTLLFKQSLPLRKKELRAEEKKEYQILKNNGLMVLFYDLERMEASSNYTLKAYINANYTATPISKDLNIQYCNQSYLDSTCGGDFTTGCSSTPMNDVANCVYLNSLPVEALQAPRINVDNSSYVGPAVFGVIDGKVGGIQTTNISYIYYNTESTAGNRYTMRYVNGTSGTNVKFNDSGLAFSTTNEGISYSSLNGTVDAYIITILKDRDQIQLGGCVWALDNESFCSYNFYSDDIGDVNFPISNPSIQYYNNGTCAFGQCNEEDTDLNGTYYGNMTIQVNIAIDPDSVGNVIHNLTLRNLDGSWNYTINGSFKSPTDSDMNIFFDTINVLDGEYKMNVTATAGDNPLDVQSFLTFENFTINNTPSINLSWGPPGTSIFRFATCSSQFENASARPQTQDDTYGIDKICNDGTPPVDVQIKLSGALNTGWSWYASNESAFATQLNLTTSWQTIYSGLESDACVYFWHGANCSYVSQNPGQYEQYQGIYP